MTLSWLLYILMFSEIIGYPLCSSRHNILNKIIREACLTLQHQCEPSMSPGMNSSRVVPYLCSRWLLLYHFAWHCHLHIINYCPEKEQLKVTYVINRIYIYMIITNLLNRDLTQLGNTRWLSLSHNIQWCHGQVNCRYWHITLHYYIISWHT